MKKYLKILVRILSYVVLIVIAYYIGYYNCKKIYHNSYTDFHKSQIEMAAEIDETQYHIEHMKRILDNDIEQMQKQIDDMGYIYDSLYSN